MPEPGISRTARHAKVASSPARAQHRLDETVLGAAVIRGTLLASFDGQGLASPLSIARACACEGFALVEVAPRPRSARTCGRRRAGSTATVATGDIPRAVRAARAWHRPRRRETDRRGGSAIHGHAPDVARGADSCGAKGAVIIARPGMERLSSQAGATGRNRWQMGFIERGSAVRVRERASGSCC
jgi:hypothetical protein